MSTARPGARVKVTMAIWKLENLTDLLLLLIEWPSQVNNLTSVNIFYFQTQENYFCFGCDELQAQLKKERGGQRERQRECR